MKILFMSIKPKYSHLIFEGSKRFELRRSSVKVARGDIVVVYASSPLKAVVGGFVVKDVIASAPAKLWREHGKSFGVTHGEYKKYFDGVGIGYAIEIDRKVSVNPISLEKLRRAHAEFKPPQSHMIWRNGLEALIGDEAAEKLLPEGINDDGNLPLFDFDAKGEESGLCRH